MGAKDNPIHLLGQHCSYPRIGQELQLFSLDINVQQVQVLQPRHHVQKKVCVCQCALYRGIHAIELCHHVDARAVHSMRFHQEKLVWHRVLQTQQCDASETPGPPSGAEFHGMEGSAGTEH